MLYSSMTVLSIGTIIGSDVLGRLINYTLSGLENTIIFMKSSGSNSSIGKYHNDLKILDIELKLKLINTWLYQIDITELSKNPPLNLIYISITESCHQISTSIDTINRKIKTHEEKWFSTWRNINLDQELALLESAIQVLDGRIKLINLIKI
jgi:hypothetical protein